MDNDRTRTLVVTLDPGLIQQIRTSLEDRGGIVSACPTGEGARDEVQQRKYGLVVISAELPDCDGYELTSELMALDAGITVMLTGEDRDGRAVERAVEAGAAGFLLRPVGTAELLQRFEDVMGNTWFDLHRTDSASVSLDPHAASLVDPRASMFVAGTGYDISVFDHDEVSVVNESIARERPEAAADDGHSSDDDSSDAGDSSDDDSRDGDSDEVGDGGVLAPDRTQELPPLAMEAFDEDNPVSIAVGADITAHGMSPVRPLTPLTSAEIREDSLEARITELLQPGGSLAHVIEEAVERAVGNALNEQLPAAFARLLGGGK